MPDKRVPAQTGLVVSEMALALLLLAGAGLLIKTFTALRHADAGFSPGHVLTIEIRVTADERDGSEIRTVHFFDELSARLTALPGAGKSSQGSVPFESTLGIDF